MAFIKIINMEKDNNIYSTSKYFLSDTYKLAVMGKKTKPCGPEQCYMKQKTIKCFPAVCFVV